MSDGGTMLTDERLEALLNRVAEQNRPLNESLLDRLDSMAKQLSYMSREHGELKTAVEILGSQELQKKIEAVSVRTKVLEDERQQRLGVVEMASWAPKVLQWLVILITVVLFFVKAKG